MDSDSSPLPFATRDGSPSAAAPAEDDGSLSVAAGLAKEAALLFQAGKLVDCLRILNQLLQKNENDAKVRHNVAIVENFQDGCSDPRRLLEALENIKKQNEELARTSGVHSEVSSNNGSRPTSSIRGNNDVVDQFSRSSVVYSDEFDTTVAMFNIAVVWFHLHEYAKSFSYLETLFQNIEPIDEGTALRICLLLLDVALLSHHASRSAEVINYMEKVFCGNSFSQVNNGASAQPQHFLVSNSTLDPGNSSIPDSSYSDLVVTANTLENSLTRTLSEEAPEDEPLHLLSSLDISGQNLQRPGIASSNDRLKSQAEESLSTVNLRLKLHLYKVRFLLLTRNLKAAKREVKMAMNIARGKDYPMALYLKSQLEYARGNPRKAIKLLMASSSRTEKGICSMYYNNLGCIYYRLGKHHTSGVFFSKALSDSSLLRKEKPRKLLSLSQDKSLLITYNCGVYSLACGRPFHAAHCFQIASLIFYNRPLLWLRLAECCLVALEKGLIKSNSSASNRSDVRVNVIGKGKWRQLVVSFGIQANGQRERFEKDDMLPGDGKRPDLSMSLARECLINALFLLDSLEAKGYRSLSPSSVEESETRDAISQITNSRNVSVAEAKASNAAFGSSHVNSNGEVKEQKGGNNQNSTLQNSIPEYEYVCLQENQMIRQATLADLAYVELELGNPLKALSTVKTLLELPECSKIYIFLGTMYAAESLCLLNRPKEAAECLMRYVSGGNNVEIPYSLEDCRKWTVEKVVEKEGSNGGSVAHSTVSSAANEPQGPMFSSPEEARGIFCANYAANFALIGDLERAYHFVTKALSDIPNSPQAVLTAIYVDLKCGKTQEALAKIKQHSTFRFLPGSLKFRGSL